MSAYWIGRAKVRDHEGIHRYGELVAKASQLYPQQVLARNARYRVLEGPEDFNRHVLIRFGSMEEALRYYNSTEYQEAAAIRQSACDRCELVITEGLD